MDAHEGTAELRNWFDAHAPFLYCWLRARINPRLRPNIDAEDLLQEVWVRAARHLAAQRVENPRGWLLAVAGHVFLETLRKWQRQPVAALEVDESTSALSLDVPDCVTSITRRVARDELRQRFFASLDSLNDEERLLVVQVGLEARPMADVASQLGIGIDAGHKRWQRLRERLRSQGSSADLF